jgi:adenylate cyclase
MNRRLAAILAADVVGYSRLMEADEPGTLVRLKARRQQVLSPLLKRYSGRLVKMMGDSVLVEFGSAVNAAQCALALQAAMNGPMPLSRTFRRSNFESDQCRRRDGRGR